MAYDGVVNEDNVYTCVGHPLKTDIRDIVTWMLNEPFSVAYNNIMNVKTLKGKERSLFLKENQIQKSASLIVSVSENEN